MTNAPEKRKTHVTRLVGTNKAGDRLEDIWVDVERIDAFTVRTQVSIPQWLIENMFQEVEIKFKWRDDPNGDDYDEEGETKETDNHKILKVCSPDEDDLENPKEWVSIKVLKRINMDQKDVGDSQKRFMYRTDRASRKVEQRRMYHYDTNIDDDATSAFDADNSLKAYVVSGSDYERDNNTKDKDDYVEHEVIFHLEKHENHEAYATGGDNQGVQLRMKNQYLIDESEEAKLEEHGEDGIDPPYRMDPYQNIINCSFGGLAVEFS